MAGVLGLLMNCATPNNVHLSLYSVTGHCNGHTLKQVLNIGNPYQQYST